MSEKRDDFYRQLGDNIRRVRLRKRVSQQELANSAGLTRTSIANAEAGRQRLPVDRLLDISVALQEPISTFLPGQTRPEEQRRMIKERLKHLPKVERDWVKSIVGDVT